MTRKTLETVILYILILSVCVVLLIPFAWLLSTALKSEAADLFVFKRSDQLAIGTVAQPHQIDHANRSGRRHCHSTLALLETYEAAKGGDDCRML